MKSFIIQSLKAHALAREKLAAPTPRTTQDLNVEVHRA